MASVGAASPAVSGIAAVQEARHAALAPDLQLLVRTGGIGSINVAVPVGVHTGSGPAIEINGRGRIVPENCAVAVLEAEPRRLDAVIVARSDRNSPFTGAACVNHLIPVVVVPGDDGCGHNPDASLLAVVEIRLRD